MLKRNSKLMAELKEKELMHHKNMSPEQRLKTAIAHSTQSNLRWRKKNKSEARNPKFETNSNDQNTNDQNCESVAAACFCLGF